MDFKNKLQARGSKAGAAASIGTALFLMLLVGGLLLLLLSFLLYRMDIPEQAVKIGIIVIYIVAGLLGGIVVGKLQRERKFLWGLLTGILYFLVLFLISCIAHGGFDMDVVKVITTLVLCAASGMAGGMLS